MKKKIKITRLRAGEYIVESFEDDQKIYQDIFRGSAKELAREVRVHPYIDVIWSTPRKKSARKGAREKARSTR